MSLLALGIMWHLVGSFSPIPALLSHQADGVDGGGESQDQLSGLVVHRGVQGPTMPDVNTNPSLLRETPKKFSLRPKPFLGSPVHHGGILKPSSFPAKKREVSPPCS